MILEIRKLLIKAEYEGEFSFEYTPSEEVVLIPLCRIEGAVKVEGDYEIFDDDSVEIRFDISYLLKGSCSYCLEDAAERVTYRSEVLFEVGGGADSYPYDGNKLDLHECVNDAIMFSQPKVLLCKADCKGIKIS